MLLAYYIHDLSPFLIQIGGFGLRWYGLAYLAGFIVGILLYKHLAKRGYSDLRPDQVTDFITMSALFGVLLGGRLGYMLFYDGDRFFHDPLIFFRVWEGGMASHGGILGLTFYTIWYARRHRLSFRNLADNLVVVGPVGVFFGRCANFINGELYGRVTDVFWAVQFPKEILVYPPDHLERLLSKTVAVDPSLGSPEAVIAGVTASQPLRELLAVEIAPRYPSQLVEAGLEGLFLFALLWMLRTRVRLANGVLTGVFFIAYAVVRFLGECFREPDAPLTGMLTRGRFLSLFMILIGIFFLLWARWKPSYPHRFTKVSSS
ncbi:MAG: prolipoprotein diacylglyceryl transferase [Chthoniobacterales bacterium]|nr:prolipoprotein diacylglyceryl transferase [Chthoniobacterales bacterium]